MAKVTASYNSQTLNDITWDAVVSKVVGKNDEVTNYRVLVTIQSVVFCASASTQATSISTLKTAFTKNGLDLTIGDGSSTIFSLTGAMCRGGGPNVDFTIPKNEFKVGFNYPIVLRVEGLILPVTPDGNPSKVIANNKTTRYAFDKQKRLTRTVSGDIAVETGETVRSYRDDVTPALTSDAFMTAESSFSGYQRVRSMWDEDEDGLTARYEFVDEAYWTTVESDLPEMDMRYSEHTEGLVKNVTISGSVAGDSTVEPADLPDRVDSIVQAELPEGGKILTKRVERDKFNCRASFSYEILAPVSDDVIEKTRRVSYRVVMQKAILPYAGAKGGVIQTVGSPFIYATESGRLVGLNAAPAIPDPSLGLPIMEAVSDCEDPYEGVDGKMRYPVTYTYSYQTIMGASEGGATGDAGWLTSGIINKAVGGAFGDTGEFSTGGTIEDSTGGLFG